MLLGVLTVDILPANKGLCRNRVFSKVKGSGTTHVSSELRESVCDLSNEG